MKQLEGTAIAEEREEIQGRLDRVASTNFVVVRRTETVT